jgi:hypothetical protein
VQQRQEILYGGGTHPQKPDELEDQFLTGQGPELISQKTEGRSPPGLLYKGGQTTLEEQAHGKRQDTEDHGIRNTGDHHPRQSSFPV